MNGLPEPGADAAGRALKESPQRPAYEYSVVDWRLVAMVAVFLAVITGIRYHGFGEPLEADEAIYALTAHDWQQGGKPYVTLWDNKPIGVFVVYRAALAVFGYDALAVRLLGLLAAIATGLVSVWWLRRHVDRRRQGLGLLLWALANGLVMCQANSSNAEVLMAPLLVGGLIACEHFLETRRERWFYVSVALAGLAFLIKPVALPFLVAPYAALGRAGWRDWVKLLRRVSYGAALAVGMYFLAYAVCGYGPGTISQVVRSSYQYAESGEGNWLVFAVKTLVTLPFRPAMLAAAPLLLPGIAGLLWLLWKRPGEKWQPLGWYLLAAAVAVVLPGQEVAHYFLLVLPFGVLAAVAATTVHDGRWMKLAAVAAVVWLAGNVGWTNLRLHPNEVNFNKYGGNWFLRDREIGRELRKWGLNGMRMFVDGTHPGVYFYSQSQPATKYYLAMYYEGFGLASWEELQRELASSPPHVMVFLNPLPPRHAGADFMPWLDANYAPLPDVYGAKVYVWRAEEPAPAENGADGGGGDLERALP